MRFEFRRRHTPKGDLVTSIPPGPARPRSCATVAQRIGLGGPMHSGNVHLCDVEGIMLVDEGNENMYGGSFCLYIKDILDAPHGKEITNVKCQGRMRSAPGLLLEIVSLILQRRVSVFSNRRNIPPPQRDIGQFLSQQKEGTGRSPRHRPSRARKDGDQWL